MIFYLEYATACDFIGNFLKASLRQGAKKHLCNPKPTPLQFFSGRSFLQRKESGKSGFPNCSHFPFETSPLEL